MRRNGYANISACGKYRYELGGDLGSGPYGLVSVIRMILWLMLNPSTADASHDDQTLRTICVFSESWGYNRVMVGNLYAYRTKDPKEMFRAQRAGVDIVGPDNDRVIAEMVGRVRTSGGIVMAAWGGNALPARVREVQQIAGARLQCLKTNKDGSPVHPLYQPHKLTPTTWEGMAAA